MTYQNPKADIVWVRKSALLWFGQRGEMLEYIEHRILTRSRSKGYQISKKYTWIHHTHVRGPVCSITRYMEHYMHNRFPSCIITWTVSGERVLQIDSGSSLRSPPCCSSNRQTKHRLSFLRERFTVCNHTARCHWILHTGPLNNDGVVYKFKKNWVHRLRRKAARTETPGGRCVLWPVFF